MLPFYWTMMFLRILTFMMWNVRKEYFINLSKCHMKWWRNIRKLIYQCHKYFMGIFFSKWWISITIQYMELLTIIFFLRSECPPPPSYPIFGNPMPEAEEELGSFRKTPTHHWLFSYALDRSVKWVFMTQAVDQIFSRCLQVFSFRKELKFSIVFVWFSVWFCS